MPHNPTFHLRLRAELGYLQSWISVKHQNGMQALVFITKKLLELHLSLQRFDSDFAVKASIDGQHALYF